MVSESRISYLYIISGVLEEARFFGIESLVPQLESLIQSSQRSRDNVPLTRRDVVNALILTPYTAELRFQGVNLAGSDLSRLDLRYINFKVRLQINRIWLAVLETAVHKIPPPVLYCIVSSDHAI
jgi:hypothetical protein